MSESPMANVDLGSSRVLRVETSSSGVGFVLDAVLDVGHPRYPQARLLWCLRGDVWWNDGPHLDQPDLGAIDAWWGEGDVEHLEGDWGAVAVRGAAHSVHYLN